MKSGRLFHSHCPSSPPWPVSSSLLAPSFSPPHLIPLCFSHRRRWRNLVFGATRNRKSDRSFRRQFPGNDGGGGSVNYSYDGVRRRGGRKRRRQWWNDDDDVYGDDLKPGVWDEFVDSFWFFKLLGFYGWLLPIIILSLLLATGPKAFLTAMSLPFGFSVLTFAFKMLWGWTQGSFEYKPSGNQKYNIRNMGTDFMDENEEIQWRRDPKVYSRSMMDGSDNGKPSQSNGLAAFGGWEDLVEDWQFETKSSKNLGENKDAMKTPLKEETSGKVEGRDQPLLMRSLIALFPFLSSWVDLL